MTWTTAEFSCVLKIQVDLALFDSDKRELEGNGYSRVRVILDRKGAVLTNLEDAKFPFARGSWTTAHYWGGFSESGGLVFGGPLEKPIRVLDLDEFWMRAGQITLEPKGPS